MSFREIENIENSISSKDIAEVRISSFQKQMLSEYIEKEKRKSTAKGNPFEFFYEDVISASLTFSFRTALGEQYYKNASDDALACLDICIEFKKVTSWNISGWLQNALKFADHIVLHYIQECCKETLKSHQLYGIERARYAHLFEKEGEISIAGAKLNDLYVLRNSIEHRTITHSNGKQELLSPRRNWVRQQVVKIYPDVLRRFLKTYENNPQMKFCK